MSMHYTKGNGRPTNLGARFERRVSSHTTNYTVTDGESGTIFNTQGAGAAVVFTLPAQKAGLEYIFSNVEDQDMTVIADAADTMAVFNDVAADQITFNTANEKVGGAFYIYSDGTNWVVHELIHDAQTTAIVTA